MTQVSENVKTILASLTLKVSDFAIVQRDQFIITYDTGVALIKFEDLDKQSQKAETFFCDMEDNVRFISVKEISFKRAVG